jgi:hypothetical protein
MGKIMVEDISGITLGDEIHGIAPVRMNLDIDDSFHATCKKYY